MATVRYKCSVCKREIELPENKRGLEVIDKCIITLGCRGDLYRIDRNPDFVRGEYPLRVGGLTDWSARRVLYNHTQSVASREWRIVHDLGVAPSVQVLIDRAVLSGEDTELVPCAVRTLDATEQFETLDFSIEIVSANEILLTFTDPQSGFAQLIARSTAGRTFEETAAEPVEPFQLTNDTLLTIATLNDTIPTGASFNLDVVYTPPSSGSITQTYSVGSGLPLVTSPWNDFTTILIEGKRYKVRTIDMFIPEFSNGIIGNGSSFYFSQISGIGSPIGRSIAAREIFILLALSPYDNVDKVLNQLINVNRVNASNAELSFYHQDRELFAFDNIIISTFPEIREV